MRLTGRASLHATVAQVYAKLDEPDVIAAAIPGCEHMERVAVDAYKVTIAAGVGSLKGRYTGDLAVEGRRAPEAFVVRTFGAGTLGTIASRIDVTLTTGRDGRTEVSYDGEVTADGAIAAVGNHLLRHAVKKALGEFFAALDVALGAEPAPSLSDRGLSLLGSAGGLLVRLGRSGG